MTRYFIESVQYGTGEGGFGCGPIDGPVIAEAKVRTDNGDSFYVCLAEVMGIANVFKTEESSFDFHMDPDEYEDELEAIQDCYLEVGDYDEIFENKDSEWYPLLRYLIYIVRAEEEECEKFINETQNKYLDEISVPASDLEEDYEDEDDDYDPYAWDDIADEDDEIEIEIPENKEDLYKLRLSTEADLETESIFHDMDGSAVAMEERQLEVLVDACESEEDYQTWKNEYIDSEYEKVKNQKFLVCHYMFAGFGGYEIIIKADTLDDFKCWINGNGSAFLGECKEADEEEIKKYIADHAADEYLK